MNELREQFNDAFDELFSLAYRVAFRIVGRRAETEEVAQEALARAFTHWQKIRGYGRPWVARVATNLALDLVRRERKRPIQDEEHVAPSPEPAAIARVDLQRVLRSLPRRQREVVSLLYLADLPAAQVAQLIGCSTGSVKQHGSRGLATLRQQSFLRAKEREEDVRAS